MGTLQAIPVHEELQTHVSTALQLPCPLQTEGFVELIPKQVRVPQVNPLYP
jgi:hypothetical protein